MYMGDTKYKQQIASLPHAINQKRRLEAKGNGSTDQLARAWYSPSATSLEYPLNFKGNKSADPLLSPEHSVLFSSESSLGTSPSPPSPSLDDPYSHNASNAEQTSTIPSSSANRVDQIEETSTLRLVSDTGLDTDWSDKGEVGGNRYLGRGFEQIGSGGSNLAKLIGELAAEYLDDRADRDAGGVDGSIGDVTSDSGRSSFSIKCNISPNLVHRLVWVIMARGSGSGVRRSSIGPCSCS